MNYVALYRKYRPVTFDDVIGQDHIINTLRNQIAKGRISHAYLFTGTRGTGKTSTAKIFARAVNCPEAPAHNGNPCMECAVCRTMLAPNMDIIEMDAASNNGVDYARDIREKVQYPPVTGKYKVYIIDEVHMLSSGAFNALLKTLEEPPSHAVFILCTTEAHKLPATILSRCMRFDFRLVPTVTLAALVSDIYAKEGKQFTADAAAAIAQAGEGSVRDCLSVADRCCSMSDGILTYDDVMSVLGVSSRAKTAALASAVLSNSAGEILERINDVASDGKDIGRLAKDLSQYFRDVLVAKTCKSPKEILCVPDEVLEELKKTADNTSVAKLLYAIEALSRLENELRYALSPLMLLEAAALRIGGSSGEVDVEGLDRRITRLEQQPENITADTLLVVDRNNAQSVWKGIKVELERQNKPLLTALWKEISVRFDEDGNFAVICGKGQYNLIEMEYMKELRSMTEKLCGKQLVLQLVEKVSERDVDKQLSSLGSNVRFDGSGKKTENKLSKGDI